MVMRHLVRISYRRRLVTCRILHCVRIEILKSVDCIAEDTRHSGILLQHLQVKVPMLALHDHNEQQRAGALIQRIQQGQSIADFDAGTPLISDPGYHLVKACRDAGVVSCHCLGLVQQLRH